jgi:hypothetical protein
VKIWVLDREECIASWSYHNGEPAGKKKPVMPTCLTRVGEGKVAIGYQNSVVKVFDVETGKEVLRVESDSTYGPPPFRCSILRACLTRGPQTGRPRLRSTPLSGIRQSRGFSPLTKIATFGSLTSTPVRFPCLWWAGTELTRGRRQDNASNHTSRISTPSPLSPSLPLAQPSLPSLTTRHSDSGTFLRSDAARK